MLENFKPRLPRLPQFAQPRPPVGTGVVDMAMTWSGGGQVSHVRDEANRFTGRKVTGTSHIS
jgi:hypothetical protein